VTQPASDGVSTRFAFHRQAWIRAGWSLALLLMLGITALTVLLAAGALFDPASSLYTRISTSIWTTFGPHLVLLSLLALVTGLVSLRRGPRFLSSVTAIVALGALLASAGITARILQAVYAAGGAADPVSGLVFASTSAAAADARETYTTAGRQALQALIYRPAATGHAAPIMLYIHGGGWIVGSAHDLASDLRWFATRGWLVVSADYRLASPSEATWDKAPEDVACALVWAARNAARLGGDAARIVVAGDSAGGNLAINLAYAAALGRATSGCGGPVPVPEAVVVQYPVVDPLDAYDHGYADPGFEPHMFISRYIGGSPRQFPDRIRAITSASYLSDRAPQTLIIQPEKDGLIPSAGVFRFVEQACASGAAITLVRIPFANHAYDQVAVNSIGSQARLTITQHYLVQRGLMDAD
jgi:acetyl esterase